MCRQAYISRRVRERRTLVLWNPSTAHNILSNRGIVLTAQLFIQSISQWDETHPLADSHKCDVNRDLTRNGEQFLPLKLTYPLPQAYTFWPLIWLQKEGNICITIKTRECIQGPPYRRVYDWAKYDLLIRGEISFIYPNLRKDTYYGDPP